MHGAARTAPCYAVLQILAMGWPLLSELCTGEMLSAQTSISDRSSSGSSSTSSASTHLAAVVVAVHDARHGEAPPHHLLGLRLRRRQQLREGGVLLLQVVLRLAPLRGGTNKGWYSRVWLVAKDRARASGELRGLYGEDRSSIRA